MEVKKFLEYKDNAIPTKNCYVILSFAGMKGLELKSDKIYGYDNIVKVAKRRDVVNNILNRLTPYSIFVEKYGFETFVELQERYEKEKL